MGMGTNMKIISRQVKKIKARKWSLKVVTSDSFNVIGILKNGLYLQKRSSPALYAVENDTVLK